jgi:hypothetical protein
MKKLSKSPSLQTVTVESSALAKVAYDHQRATLQVEFRDGAVYQYFDVPVLNYHGLLQANSKGDYFNRHIRNLFTYMVLHPADTARTVSD